jgi:hypothetical protein
MSRRRVVAGILYAGLLAPGLVAGCGESTAPYARSSGIRVEALVPLYGAGFRETEVADLPAVKVTNFSSGKAISGRPVVFTFDTDEGVKTPLTVLTGADGVARLPGWRLGRNLGRYAVTAATDGFGPITFTRIVPGDAVAIYDLQSFNGMPASEAHLVLYEIGLHNHFVGNPVKGFTIAPEVLGAYTRSGPDRIDFSTQCSYAPFGCAARRMTAAVRGTELIVDESDPYFGPWLEVYALRVFPEEP